jgi:hypothetical protein
MGVPVRRVLEIHTSRELAQWAAYERYAGPLDGSWEAETLAQLHEMTQNLCRMFGAANFERNPMPEPAHHKRPHEVHDRPPQDTADDDEPDD